MVCTEALNTMLYRGCLKTFSLRGAEGRWVAVGEQLLSRQFLNFNIACLIDRTMDEIFEIRCFSYM